MNRQLLRISRPTAVLRFARCKQDDFSSVSAFSSLRSSLQPKRSQFVAHFSSSATLRDKMGSEIGSQVQDVDYDGLVQAQNDNSVLIIDVREQKEIDETGKLPGSIHIPMGNVKNVLETVSGDDFKEKYGKPKPEKGTKIILSCRAGGRSRMVQDELQKIGYSNAWNYAGGWLDWESKQKS